MRALDMSRDGVTLLYTKAFHKDGKVVVAQAYKMSGSPLFSESWDCGYVFLPLNHPWAMYKNSWEVEIDQNECTFLEPKDGMLVAGFDCAHSWMMGQADEEKPGFTLACLTEIAERALDSMP